MLNSRARVISDQIFVSFRHMIMINDTIIIIYIMKHWLKIHKLTHVNHNVSAEVVLHQTKLILFI